MTVRHVVFVGAMGSGKTTIGTRVAAALDRPFVDNDQVLERVTGRSAAVIAARDGLEALHRAEATIALQVLNAHDDAVIAAASSTVTDADVRLALRTEAWVAWLRADDETLIARLPESSTRPYAEADPVQLVRDQARRRDPLFAEVADATFDTAAADVDAVVERVLESARQRGLRM